jgi:hypothetical protein
MPDLARLPITVATAGSGYTLDLSIGSRNTAVTVVVDTGSSMAAVISDSYDPGADPAATTTQLLQSSRFGGGKLLAAVVRAPVGFAGIDAPAALAQANLGIVYNPTPSLFGRASGILGLAYPALSPANRMQADTWATRYAPADFQNGVPAGPVAPYLDQLVAADRIADKFAFSVQRSFRCQADDSATADKLNTGTFVVGGGEECNDLYTGEFASVPIVHESYFSTTLLAIQVGDRTIPVPSVPAGSQADSNAFFDSGCNYLQFEPALYQAIIAQFPAALGALIRTGYADQTRIDLTAWPDLRLVLQGEAGTRTTLTVAPNDYWQFDSYGAETARFTLSSGAGPYPGQSLLGLPLFAGHYVVFDRTGGPGQGVVKFAAQPSTEAGAAPLTS